MTARERAREAARQAARHDNGHDDDVRAEEAADAASDEWESWTATAELENHGIDLERLTAILESKDNWGSLVHAFEVLTILEAVKREMEALG